MLHFCPSAILMLVVTKVLFFVCFRAAASRCRQKRKVWVQQLEKKADDLSATNVNLQV